VNCPFDDEYRPLLRAAIFTVQACGFTARIALENTGSEGVRLDRLVKIIGECELGIGPTAIIVLYNNFVSALPAIAPEADLTLADIEPLTAFNDWYLLAARWLQQQAAGKH
jgi:hypothetical protein